MQWLEKKSIMMTPIKGIKEQRQEIKIGIMPPMICFQPQY